jgi:hypothetical protein
VKAEGVEAEGAVGHGRREFTAFGGKLLQPLNTKTQKTRRKTEAERKTDLPAHRDVIARCDKPEIRIFAFLRVFVLRGGLFVR